VKRTAQEQIMSIIQNFTIDIPQADLDDLALR
jgi:hypothetical protein